MSTSEKSQRLLEATTVLLISLAVFAMAVATERSLVPDIVPIAFAESPQPIWAVEFSFFLHTVELIAGSVSFFALCALGAMATGDGRSRAAEALLCLTRLKANATAAMTNVPNANANVLDIGFPKGSPSRTSAGSFQMHFRAYFQNGLALMKRE